MLKAFLLHGSPGFGSMRRHLKLQKSCVHECVPVNRIQKNQSQFSFNERTNGHLEVAYVCLGMKCGA